MLKETLKIHYTKWIDCEEKMPIEGEQVLVYEDYCFFTAHYRNNKWYISCNCGTDSNTEPTHWMHLPNPPDLYLEEYGTWISINDRLPNNNQLIKAKSDSLWKAEGIFQDGKFCYSAIKGACFGNITHWMPWKKETDQ